MDYHIIAVFLVFFLEFYHSVLMSMTKVAAKYYEDLTFKRALTP